MVIYFALKPQMDAFNSLQMPAENKIADKEVVAFNAKKKFFEQEIEQASGQPSKPPPTSIHIKPIPSGGGMSANDNPFRSSSGGQSLLIESVQHTVSPGYVVHTLFNSTFRI